MIRTQPHFRHTINHHERGIALLMVLFIVSLLIIIAAEFTYTTRMELEAAENFKEDVEGYYYAHAGFQYALTEIISEFDSNYLSTDGQVGFYRNWKDENAENQNQESDEETIAWPPIPNRSGVPLGDGAFDYIITDEEGRINLNYLETRISGTSKTAREVFRELLVETGVEEGEPADIIIDSILDWIDRGDEHRLNGAEDDWYDKNFREQGFEEAYHCKNGKLDTIEELLMIRGMTPDILYGSNSIYASSNSDETQYSGILPYITVYGYNRRINLNTAPPLLLRIIDPDSADERIEKRENPAEKTGRKPSRTFRVEVRGYRKTSLVSHYILAVVRRSYSKGNGGGAEIYYWNDDALSFGSDLSSYLEEDVVDIE